MRLLSVIYADSVVSGMGVKIFRFFGQSPKSDASFALPKLFYFLFLFVNIVGSRAILNVTKSCVDDTFCENERSKTENPNCDVLSEDNYDCVWCCHEDKCNENSAGHFLQGDYSAILVTMVIAISFHVLQLLSSSEGNLLSVGDR